MDSTRADMRWRRVETTHQFGIGGSIIASGLLQEASMRCLLTFAALLILPVSAFGADPAYSAAPRATQPTTQPNSAAPQPARVMLLRLGEISDGAPHAWVGRAIQQSLLSDLAR